AARRFAAARFPSVRGSTRARRREPARSCVYPRPTHYRRQPCNSPTDVERDLLREYRRATGHPAGGGELPREVVWRQGRGRTLPGECFGPFRLAQGFEQANALSVGIEAVDVVQDEGLMTVLVSLEVNAKGGSLAADPADLSPQRLADTAAL